MMGLLFGTTLLAMGVALGVWLARRNAVPDAPINRTQHTTAPEFDPQQFLAFMRNMALWTNDFAGDVSKYQSTLQSLTKQASDGTSVQNKEEVQKLLDRIVAANNELQSRLDSAEKKLDAQTKQLAGYLNEARSDSLTGLANRRAFDQKMDEQFSKWKQSRQTFSLALIDIDHFKKINDTYGHPAGDAVLREMAQRLRSINDQAELIARYGGEEFGVVFQSTLEKAASTMEQLRLTIAKTPFAAEGKTIPVTISTGVAQIHGEERLGNLVRRSDEALYSAKLGGRNRVCIHNNSVCEVFGNPQKASSPVTVPANAATNESTAAPSVSELEQRVLQKLDSLIASESDGIR